MSHLDTPPRWCKDAIATEYGWKHPRTGELLVAIRGLDLDKFNKRVVENELVVVEVQESDSLVMLEEVKSELVESVEEKDSIVIEDESKDGLISEEKKPGRRGTRKPKEKSNG